MVIMVIFDFLKKIFGWADEHSRKRSAFDSFGTDNEYITQKKPRYNYKTAHTDEHYFDVLQDSDGDDIEIIDECKYSHRNSCCKVNGTQGSSKNNFYSYREPPTVSKDSFTNTRHNKLAMGYYIDKGNKTANVSAECPTLVKTHQLKQKSQYGELLQTFLPHRIHILQNKTEEPRPVQKCIEVIDLDKVETSTPCKPQEKPRFSQNVSHLRWSFPNKSMKENEKVLPTVSTIRNQTSELKRSLPDSIEIRKSETSNIKPTKNNYIETVATNTLRDKLASKAVTREDFIPQVAKRYNERIEQHHKEAEELKKMMCVLSKHNRLAREAHLEEQLARSMRLYEAVLDEREEPEEPSLPTLTEDMLKEVKQALVSRPADEVLVESYGLRITRKDMNTLADLNWLNDEVINFYMNLLIARGTTEKFPKVHAMNTFFYPKLLSGGHSSLKRWTRKVDIFAQDLVVVPVHLGIHWCMSIIDFRDKSIRYYDSMGSSNQKCLNALRQYLEEESLDKKKQSFDTNNWKLENVKNIPQQMNGSDCGVFSCMFAEYICANRKITFTQEDMPFFRNKMAYEILKNKLL